MRRSVKPSSTINPRETCAAIVIAAAAAAPALATNPLDFATSVVASNLDGETLQYYNNPAAVLGAPTITFNDPYGSSSGDLKHYDNSKVIEPPYDTDYYTGADVITEIPKSTATATYSVTVQMGRPITHEPGNPYGLDFIVYGNSFFAGTGSQYANDTTNLNTYKIGSVYGHPAVVSVSPDDVNWYTYPVVPLLLPFQAYQWDSVNAVSTMNLLNVNAPVNPTVASMALSKGYSTAALVLAAYGNASGGTGFSIAASGFSSIDYIRVASSTTDYSVIDSIAAVDPVPEPASLCGISVVGLLLLRRRR